MARMINEFWSDPRWPFFSSSGAGTISPVIRFHRARPSSLFIFFRLCGYIRVFKKYLLFFLRCFFFFFANKLFGQCVELLTTLTDVVSFIKYAGGGVGGEEGFVCKYGQ